MATRKKSQKVRHPLAKGTTVGVRLGEQDLADLVECAALESQARNEIVHEATLLRELGMQPVRDRLAELRKHALRSGADRREAERREAERRQPAVASR